MAENGKIVKAGNSLEQIVVAARPKQGVAADVVRYAVPFLIEYDAVREAEKLLKSDVDVANTGISVEEAARYLAASHAKYARLFTYGKVADSADRLTSLVGMVVESVGVFFGVAPGFAGNIVEETVEMAAKVPFIYEAYKDPNTRSKLPLLLTLETLTFGVPVGGDVFDAVANMYVHTAYQVIREDAVGKILADAKKKEAEKLTA
jgi:hypothetical protein